MALFRKVLMELLQEMGGLQNFGVALPARDGQMHHEAAVAFLEGESEGLVVDDLEGEGIAGGGARVAHPGGDDGGQFLVEHEVFNGEAEVFHGHFRAVGPLQALAELEGEHGVILVHFVRFHDVGVHLVGVGGLHGQKAFGHAHEHVRVPVDGVGDKPQGAAKVTDFRIQIFVQEFVNQAGVFRQTLFHRGQFAAFHQRVEHGGLGVGSFGSGRHCAQGQHHGQNQQPRQFLHGGSSFFSPNRQTPRPGPFRNI